MNDLIKRSEAVRLIRFLRFFLLDEARQETMLGLDEQAQELLDEIIGTILDECVEIIKNVVPKAKIEEETGHWIHYIDSSEPVFFRERWGCSKCNFSSTYGASGYCPHCGSRMIFVKDKNGKVISEVSNK